ncbi:hypothetical protein [Novosphingobium rosa]|uniref:hypothetical protein n=1 Tax=Novosphingobium rosa TaxID=76978 RepID=UPI000B0A00EB|nr:hypothetical protein [Novosphingobium rosa]
MAALAPVAMIISAAAAVGSTAYAIAGSGQKINQPVLPVTRDDASTLLQANDQLAARRGGASDILNGDAGITQQMPGPKTVLGN